MLYIHIGLPKTATTFFQERIFPYWDNVEYLGRNMGYDVPFKVIPYIQKDKKYLISEEGISGLRFKSTEEKELAIENLHEMFPNAKIMISFRKHQSLITSFYKQSIRRGETFTFEEFFDINSDLGILKRDAINYMGYIKLIEKHFEEKPFVYLQEELKDNLPGLLEDMAVFFEEDALNLNKLNLAKINEGIGYYQGKLLLQFNKAFKSDNNPHGFLPHNKLTHVAREASKIFCLKLAPLSSKGLKMPQDQKKLTNSYYEEDWDHTLKYIASGCPYRMHFGKKNYK